MRYYTKNEWFNEQYKSRWNDCPYFRSMVENGELPAEYIGRRTVMVNEHDGQGCQLLTEGFHFMVYDEEGRKYIHKEARK